MASLPEEMIILILSRVPAKSILRFRCVSTCWLALIDNSRFIKLHLHRAIELDCMNLILVCGWPLRPCTNLPEPKRMYLLDQDIKIQTPPVDIFHYSRVVGSCNGLVCLIEYRHLLLFNPITREYKTLEFANEHGKPNVFKVGYCVYGLGYDSAIDDYKLVQSVNYGIYDSDVQYGTKQIYSDRNSKINVYSLNDSSCLTISEVPYCFSSPHEWGIYLNGAIHWVGKRINTRHEKLIICFDTTEKVIREIPLPDIVDKTSCVTLGVLGGKLCMFLNFYFEIWVMKNYGESSSWYKLVSMDRNVFISVLASCSSSLQDARRMYSLLSAAKVECFSKSGEILLSCSRSRRLFTYNLEQNTSRHIEIPDIGNEYLSRIIISNVASYVPLNSGSYLQVVERELVPEKRKASNIQLSVRDEEAKSGAKQG